MDLLTYKEVECANCTRKILVSSSTTLPCGWWRLEGDRLPPAILCSTTCVREYMERKYR